MKQLSKFLETFKILYTLGISPLYIFKKGSSLSSVRIVYCFKKLVQRDIDTLIDVGANQGQFALAWKKFYPGSRIFSFEPVPETFQKLKANTQPFSNINPLNMALGSKSGKLSIYKNGHSHASSFLKVSQFQKEHIPATVDEKPEEVAVATLDAMSQELGHLGCSVLKLDVQGFEREVLLGAGNVLKNIDFLIIEMSFRPMYEGEVLFEKMDDFLKDCGFRIVAPLGFLQTNDLQIPQIDFLYQRMN
jgi:FkbM family methyltransferase